MMEGDLLKMNLQVQNPQNNFTRTENIQQSLSYPVIGLVESIKFYDPQIHSEILKRFPQLGNGFIELFLMYLLSLILKF